MFTSTISSHNCIHNLWKLERYLWHSCLILILLLLTLLSIHVLLGRHHVEHGNLTASSRMFFHATNELQLLPLPCTSAMGYILQMYPPVRLTSDGSFFTSQFNCLDRTENQLSTWSVTGFRSWGHASIRSLPKLLAVL